MSEVLELEVKTLKGQLENQTKGIENLFAQIDSHKGLITDLISSVLALKTSNTVLTKEKQVLTQQLADANAKLAIHENVKSLEADAA